MAIYRNVQMSFWTDSKVIDDFTADDRFIYLYLLTNPHTNLCGCYEVSFKQISLETGLKEDKVQKLIERMETVLDVIRYNRDNKEILLLNWGKHNWTASEKFMKALNYEIERVKTISFREYLFALATHSDTVSIPYPYGMDTTVTVTDTVSDTVSVNKNNGNQKENKKTITIQNNNIYTEKPTGDPKTIPPKIEWVKEYCRIRRKQGNPEINPDQFFLFYESKGWMVGKNRMVNWQRAVQHWETEQKKRTPTYTEAILNRNSMVDQWLEESS